MFLVFNACFSGCFSFLTYINFFFFFCNAQLLYEKLESCPNVVDVRMVLCLFELMNCWNSSCLQTYFFHFELTAHCAH